MAPKYLYIWQQKLKKKLQGLHLYDRCLRLKAIFFELYWRQQYLYVLTDFQDYADHFKLRDYIQLKTEVVKIEQAEDYQMTGRWNVHVKREGEEIVKKVFDFVMICSSYVSEPHIPNYPGQEDFTGEVLHSCQYRTSDRFIDKNVLIIGMRRNFTITI